jgi:hypothetical protein
VSTNLCYSPGRARNWSNQQFARQRAAGVFLDDSQPDPSAPAPAPYDFASTDSRNYLALRPKLNQPFYIGDGVTTNGVPQIVVAPSRATRLFLGITDGSGWYNNPGSFAVDITVASTLPDMGPFDYSTGGTPAYSNNSWQFTAFYSAPPTDLKLRVQFLLSPCSGACVYTNLPGNAYMTRVTPGGNNWILNTTDVPSGDVFFQIVASAAGYLDIAPLRRTGHGAGAGSVCSTAGNFVLQCQSRRARFVRPTLGNSRRVIPLRCRLKLRVGPP